VTGAGDILKALIPALVFRLVWNDAATPYYLIVAGMAIVGHDWPLYYKFKGGRGLSPITGGMLVMDPLGFIGMSVLSTVLGLVVIRGMYGILFAYAGVIILMIPWTWFMTQDVARTLYVVWTVLVFFVAMIPDIKNMQRMRAEGFEMSTEDMLASMPMGRGLEKIKSFFTRGRKTKDTPAEERSD
jgi:glycerol-3-phosphate acyltransferase PlsY